MLTQAQQEMSESGRKAAFPAIREDQAGLGRFWGAKEGPFVDR